MQETWRAANPQYEEMEGVVAGVPELSEFDVIIDAGSDASDPESAVPFDVELPGGKVLEQPGNFFFLTETSLFGTNPEFQAKGVEPDLDGDGKTTFGEAVPDADMVIAFTRDFAAQAKELDAAAHAWEPERADALQALVTMTPTMSEYFGQWKNSRFIAGAKADEQSFAASSRLQDIEDILSGLVLIYDNVEPAIAEADAAQAEQTGRELVGLRDFAADLRDEGGRRHEVQRRAGGHARRRGAGPRGGDRRAGLAGRGAARDRARVVVRRAAVTVAVAVAVACCGGRARSSRAAVEGGGAGPRGAVRRAAGAAARRGRRRAAVARAARAYRGRLRAGIRRADPAAHRDVVAGLAAARRARDAIALAAARGSVAAALYRGAAAVTYDAVGRGDARTARAWLLLREFRTPTRYTRPGADATVALRDLERGRTSPERARLAVVKDLLDSTQAEARERLEEIGRLGERGFAAHRAALAAQVAGAWPLLAPRYREERGDAAERDAGAAVAALRDAAAARRRRRGRGRARRRRSTGSPASPPRRSPPRSRRGAPTSSRSSCR